MYIADYKESDIVSAAPLRGESSVELREKRSMLLSQQGLPSDPDTIVLANFNQLWKIDSNTLKSWANILRRSKVYTTIH